MSRTSLISIIFVLVCLPDAVQIAKAQQVDCTVQVNYEAVANANKDLLRNFAEDVRTYVNNYQWGSENVQDKVKCALNIFVQSAIGENKYSAQVFVGSQRPIYGSEKSCAVVRLFDENWEFTYIQDRPVNHNPYTFNDLASFLDFYMFLIVGYDADTYEKLGGTAMFQRASDVANLGRSTGAKGWQPATTGYSRSQLIEEILTPKYDRIRSAYYRYHFAGLDSIAANPEAAYANVLRAVENIGEVRKEAGSRNLMIKTFFDTKYLELAELFVDSPDRSVYVKFSNIDPTHLKTYEEYRQKRPQ